MKRIFSRFAAMAVVLSVVFGVTGCGDSQAEKLARLDAAAAALDSVLSECGAPVTDVKAVANDADVLLSVAVKDSVVNASLVGAELMDYFVAQQLKSMSKDVVNSVTKAIEGTQGAVKLTLTDMYGTSAEFSFTGESVRHLYKAKGSELNAPRVKEQVCALFEPALPNAAARIGADHVELGVDKGFLTYTVVFPSDKAFRDSGQGLLTRLYMKPFQDQYAALGCLEAPVVDLLKSLKIDGVCVIYKALNGDKEIRQSFPWRIVLEQ